MDYQLRGSSGLDFIAQLKTRHGNFAPFIFLTGVDNPTLYDELKKLNVFDYFIKSEMTVSLLERACFYAIERYEASVRYNKEREFSKYLIENLNYFVIEIDTNGEIKRSNEAYNKFRDSILSLCAGDIQNDFLNYLNNKTKKFIFDFPVEKQTMHTKWQRITSQFSENYTYIGEDTTEQVQHQESEIARRRLETLGHLAGGIAHELNNTLQPIILRNDLLKDIGDSLDNKDIIEHTKENRIMLNHGSAIVSDILDFSNSHDDYYLQHTDSLYDRVNTALDFIRRSLPEHSILNIHIDENIKKYNANISDNGLLKVLSNIVHNAAQSMDMVGTIQADFSICDTGPNSRGHAVCIQVEDSGAGMDDAVLKNIFSPFFTTRAPGKGTGLGMSVVHAIIQKLGGDIKVSSKVGVGTKINIYIPVIPEQTEHT